MQPATQEILHCQLPGNVMCSLAFFKHAIEQNVALQVAEKVELSSTVRKIYWEDKLLHMACQSQLAIQFY